MRHRAVELGDRVTYVRSEGYAVALREHIGRGPVEVVHPTSSPRWDWSSDLPRSWT